jgi:hypothetical protein
MNFSFSIRPALSAAGLCGALTLGLCAVATPVQAAAFSGLDTWDKYSLPSGFNAYPSATNNSVELNTASTSNLDKNTQSDPRTLQGFLGIPFLALDAAAGFPNFKVTYEGAAIQTTFDAEAGDTFSFDYALTRGFSPVFDAPLDDIGFFVANGIVTNLVGTSDSGSFQYVIPSTGPLTLALGVVNVFNVEPEFSTLRITNAQFTPFAPPVTPIPTPALLPGLIGLGVAAARKRSASV